MKGSGESRGRAIVVGQAAPVASTLIVSDVMLVLVWAVGLDVPNARQGDEAAGFRSNDQTERSIGRAWRWTGRSWQHCQRVWRATAVLVMARESVLTGPEFAKVLLKCEWRERRTRAAPEGIPDEGCEEKRNEEVEEGSVSPTTIYCSVAGEISISRISTFCLISRASWAGELLGFLEQILLRAFSGGVLVASPNSNSLSCHDPRWRGGVRSKQQVGFNP